MYYTNYNNHYNYRYIIIRLKTFYDVIIMQSVYVYYNTYYGNSC